MKHLSLAIAAATVLVASANYCQAQQPIVPGFQRFFSDDKADKAQGGQLLLGELNCTSSP